MALTGSFNQVLGGGRQVVRVEEKLEGNEKQREFSDTFHSEGEQKWGGAWGRAVRD